MIESIKNRRSIRKFLEKPLEEEKLTTILEAARLAPSGNNAQPWHFIVVKDEEAKQVLAKAVNEQNWIAKAPVVIVAVADSTRGDEASAGTFVDEESPSMDLKRGIRDTTIAVSHILLEVDNQGLGACYCGGFTQKSVRQVLGIPDDKFVVAVIPIGYPAENPAPRPRKSLDEIVKIGHW